MRNRSVLAALVLFACIFAGITPVSGADTAWFSITTNPAGAYACIDGYYCANTPSTFSESPNTFHTITISKSGYQQWSSYQSSGNNGATTVINVNLVESTALAGYLQFTPSFAGEVIINNNDYGSDVTWVSLAPGTYTVLLKKAGYYNYQTQVQITSGQTTTISPTLTPYPPSPEYGDLQVQSTPYGAAVYVNGNYQGTTYSASPLYITQLKPGTYSVQLSMPDYQTYTTSSVVQAGSTNDITVTMTPVSSSPPDTTGQINIVSSPAGANVYLDNVYKGLTPVVLSDIPAGNHIVLLQMSGYQDWSSSVNVTGGGYTQVSANLNKAGKAPATSGKAGLPFGIAIAAAGIGAALFLKMKRE